VVWIFLIAFCQTYSENQEQKTKKKDLKNLQFGQKRSIFKVDANKGAVVEEFMPLKRITVPCTRTLGKMR
jgi:hypothetical protein